ncbi:hypothetical protein M2164_000080 [Streptomyces sp. SAI-208]|uniref:hypothetical protein n=1 Tax=Streptomyces sp. SAI-208 TaxID=2940550 RepID=UPI00247470A7|nr:hypothetical protein [Streptomyces sp. SAI-208]MDH6604445.1 hypothetical protein [Streptomyces sp. SAI-208]
MSESSAPEVPEDEASTSEAASTEDERSEEGSRPAVAAAKAAAASQIEKAKNARATSAVRDHWIIGLPGALSFLAAFASAMYLFSYHVDREASGDETGAPYSAWWPVAAAGLFIVLGVIHQVREASRKAAYQEVLRVEDLKVRMVELDYVPETDAPLSANRALLQEYHRLSTGQANAAFRVAVWVMTATAILVLAGAVTVVLIGNTATAITLASLTAFISVLSGYVSATLLATYRVSVEQARFYFREPLAGGYLLAAEHLAKRVPAPDHIPALQRVVDGFIQAAVNVPGVVQDAATPQDPQGPATPA